MTSQEARNRRFLTDLFAGPFRGHAIIMVPPRVSPGPLGDFTISDRPVTEWLPWAAENYRRRVEMLEAVDDDSVPYIDLNTNTGVFAAAFGCALHKYADEFVTNIAARPLVFSAAEADALPEPDLNGRVISRFFELAEAIRRELGPKVTFSVPDIQSPFDIAALIWNKEDLFIAMYEEPEAVHRLVDKCRRLLIKFLTAFKTEFPDGNLCHCPVAWAPQELGLWLSEDEVGAITPAMFEEFCLPSLVELSEQFGGMFMHCCATADHQYPGFKKIPNLRGLNRAFQEPGPRPAFEVFSDHTVFMQAWQPEEVWNQYLELALPETRFLFNVGVDSIEQAKPIYERLRARCPRW